MAMLRVYRNLDELVAIRPAWDELLAHYPSVTTFSTWEWLSCWWRSFGTDQQLLVLAWFEGNSLLGLAPLSISTERRAGFSFRVLRLMGDGSNDSDNLDMPVQPGCEQEFAANVLRYLQEHKHDWDICELNTMPQDSLAGRCLHRLSASPGWTCFTYPSRCSAVHLPETWESYLGSLSSEDSKNLARYTRRLESRYATRIYRCTEQNELPAKLESLFRLHQERWQGAGEPGSFSSPERREFYFRLSECLLERRRLELWVLELDGEIAAVQFAFRHGDRVFQLQEGYDSTKKSDRLGFVLRGAVLKQLISDGIRIYDFLGGEDPYKARWGAQESHYRNLHFAPALGVGGMWLQFVDKAGKSKNWLRQNLPSSAWRLLQSANDAFQERQS